MSYSIVDFDQYQIYITDGLREYYIPKFRLSMTVSEPNLTLVYNASERGGHNRKLIIDYRDVESYGYDIATSAADLKDIIEAMQVSGWTNIQVGDLLNAKGQLLSHDGISDAILAAGTNEYILSRNNSEATGLQWIPKSDVTGSKKVVIPVYAANQTGAQNTTYFFGGVPSFVPQTTITRVQFPIPVTGTIIEVYLRASWGNTASGNDHTIYVRINNTTDVLVATTPISGAASSPLQINTTGLSQAVTKGDTGVMKWLTPATWTTPATNLFWTGFIVIETT